MLHDLSADACHQMLTYLRGNVRFLTSLQLLLCTCIIMIISQINFLFVLRAIAIDFYVFISYFLYVDKAFESHIMHFVRVCTVNQRLRILSDVLNVLPKFSFLSSRRCYCVALRASSIAPYETSRIGSSGITTATVRLSSAHYLPTVRCAFYSDSFTDAESSNVYGDDGSEDFDCGYSDGSSLHNPVLAKEVVDLISPAKGQVCFYHCCE